MKAIVQRQYGTAETLIIEDVPAPAATSAATPALASDRVLIKVMATSLNAPDWRLLKESPGSPVSSMASNDPRTPSAAPTCPASL